MMMMLRSVLGVAPLSVGWSAWSRNRRSGLPIPVAPGEKNGPGRRGTVPFSSVFLRRHVHEPAGGNDAVMAMINRDVDEVVRQSGDAKTDPSGSSDYRKRGVLVRVLPESDGDGATLVYLSGPAVKQFDTEIKRPEATWGSVLNRLIEEAETGGTMYQLNALA